MVRWLRWYCPPDTEFEIRALAVWGRARYLSVTEAPHNTDFHTWMGKKHFCFFETAETGNRTPNSGVKGSGANHYPRAPALSNIELGCGICLNCKFFFLSFEAGIVLPISSVKWKYSHFWKRISKNLTYIGGLIVALRSEMVLRESTTEQHSPTLN